jgi:PIN domain nuclease of toxin-antitoxin system
MRLLLDTHTVLWFFGEVEKLSEAAYTAIMSPENEKHVSIVSVWEAAIKISLKKLHFEGGIANFLALAEENGFTMLPIKSEYIKLVEKLLFLHRDPFDRMLIASAVFEGLNLVSTDTNIQKYDVPVIW